MFNVTGILVCYLCNIFDNGRDIRMKCVHLPVYSAMEVMEDAVEPLSQSLSAVRLLLRLPGNDSTESQLEDRMNDKHDVTFFCKFKIQQIIKRIKIK